MKDWLLENQSDGRQTTELATLEGLRRWQSLEEALDIAGIYYNRGLATIPLKPHSKEPIPECRWSEFYERKLTWSDIKSLYQVAYERYGLDFNIATLLGNLYGLVVIDIDDETEWSEFEAEVGLVASRYAVWIATSGKGRHIYFRYPSGVAELKSLSHPKSERGNRTFGKVELLGDRRYVLLPPSIHPNGSLYQWHPERNPFCVPEIEELPQTYLQRFISATATTATPQTEATTTDLPPSDVSSQNLPTWLTELVAKIAPFWNEGSRHNLTLAITGLMLKHHLPLDLAKAFVDLVVSVTGDTEWKDRHRVVTDTYAKTPEEVAGYQLLANIVGDAVAKEIVALLPSQPTERRDAFINKPVLTDAELAELVIAYFGDKIMYVPAVGFYVWNGKRFVYDTEDLRTRRMVWKAIELEMAKVKESRLPDDEKERCLKWLAKSKSSFEVSKCLTSLKSLLAVETKDDDESNGIDADDYLLNLQNGVLDLRSVMQDGDTFDIRKVRLMPHNPSFRLTQIANFEFNPDADCPRFKAFLNEIFLGDQQLIEDVQRFLGYALTGDVSQRKIFFLYGEGSNGKSTLLNIIAKCFGTYAKTVSADILLPKHKRMSQHPEVIADLFKVRFAIVTEWKEDEPISSSHMKMLTSKEKLTARQVHGKRFQFRPTHKLFITTNHLPKTEDLSEGFWQRIIAIPFKYRIPPEKQNPYLAEEIFEAEKAGILNWLLEGLWRYFKLGHLNPLSKAIQQTMRDYRSSVDVLEEWLQLYCDRSDADAVTLNKDLYDCYLQVMKEWQVPQDDRLSIQSFAKELEKKGFIRLKPKNKLAWRGIRLKERPKEVDTQQALSDLMPTDGGDGDYEDDDAFIF